MALKYPRDRVLPNKKGFSEGLFLREVVFPRRQGLLTFSPPFGNESIKGRLIYGDNLEAMESLIKEGLSGSIKLIYIDPPFATGAEYAHKTRVGRKALTLRRPAYRDPWEVEPYLKMLEPRIELMKELLEPEGAIFVHCDWRMNAYIRVLMDRIFGRKNFLNEIIWNYGGRGAKAISGQFPRNHDTILVYGRGPDAGLKKLYIERHLTEREALSSGFRVDEEGRFFKTAPRGDYTDESIKRLDKEGRIHRTRNGSIRIKYFLEKRGDRIVDRRLVGDVWDDIPDVMHCPPSERTAYGTQKPEALLRRIIEAGSEEGELVADFFSGSGTTGYVADRLNRAWITCDNSAVGIQVARARLVRGRSRPFIVEKLKGSNEKGKEGRMARVVLHEPLFKEIGSKRVRVSLRLKDYMVDSKTAVGWGLSCEGIKSFMEEATSDFRLLIEYWDVDWDYDGRVFKSMWQSTRPGGRRSGFVECSASAELEKKRRRIAVRAIDVLGNESFTIVESST